LTESAVSAAFLEGLILILIKGEGSVDESAALKDFYRSMIDKGAQCFCIDLANCPYMYSTFIGMLVRMGLDMEQRFGTRLTLTGVSEKNLKLLETLQLSQVFDIKKVPYTDAFKTIEDIPCKPCTNLEKAELILNAHDTLAEISDINKIRFEDVRNLMQKDVERLRLESKPETE